MPATLRPYAGDADHARIRQFLIDTYALYGRPYNWLIDRWNFCRYLVVPLHSYYNLRPFGVPTRPRPYFRDERVYWERAVGVWEDGGEIVAVAHAENEEPGEAWFQVHPDYHDLYDELVTYAEERLADRVDGLAYVKLYVNDGSPLEGVAVARGYRRLEGWSTRYLEYLLDDLPEPQLPQGYVLKSVAEEDDPDKRRSAKALAFGGHYAPSDWAPAAVYREMQRAPDYRPELDLFIVAPNGDYAAFCTIWVDQRNRYAIFEPVGTHVEYQRRGLGTALLRAGFRLMAQWGAERTWMASGNPFYHKVGFYGTPYSYTPWIRYFPA